MSTINSNASVSAASYQSPASSLVSQQSTAEDMFARFDTDGDTVISRTEFVASLDAREAQRGERGGRTHECGRTPDEYAAAVRDAQVSGGGPISTDQLAVLQEQVASLTEQLQSLIDQVYGSGASLASSDAGSASTSAAVSDAALAASSMSTSDATSDATSAQDAYQYATDEAGNTYAIDGTGNVYAVAEDGTGTLVQAAEAASGDLYTS